MIEAAATHLRRRRYKVRVVNGELSAEAGHLREFGNLVVHTCLLVVIIGASITFLLGYRLVTIGSALGHGADSMRCSINAVLDEARDFWPA